MGLFSWFFPSAEQRLARARGHLQAGRWIAARDEVQDLDSDDARALVGEAQDGLVRTNLQTALQWGEAGDDDRVELHMELAEQWHRGGLEEELRTARRTLREHRAARRAEADAERAAREADRAREAGRPLDGPSVLDEDAEERAVRLALVVENYPAALKRELDALGEGFGHAVLDLEDGRPDLALPALLALDDRAPAVRWERARAAYNLGDRTAATRELRVLAELAGGHQHVGAMHSGVMLSLWTAELGDFEGALRVLRSVRADNPKVGSELYAQLLEATGELAEAEQVCRALIATAPKSDGLYLLLARVRLKGGHREAAKAALEAAMSQVCCTPGKCGNKAPDAGVLRTLATLYLEDASDVSRGLELAAQAQELGHKGEWDDAYLDALVARASGHPEAGDAARRLFELTPEQHPGRGRLSQYLLPDAQGAHAATSA